MCVCVCACVCVCDVTVCARSRVCVCPLMGACMGRCFHLTHVITDCCHQAWSDVWSWSVHSTQYVSSSSLPAAAHSWSTAHAGKKHQELLGWHKFFLVFRLHTHFQQEPCQQVRYWRLHWSHQSHWRAFACVFFWWTYDVILFQRTPITGAPEFI